MDLLNGNVTLTVLNKLDARDNIPDRVDVWYKTELTDCVWVNTINRTVTATSTIIGQSVTCRIPKNEDYRPYEKWKLAPNDYFNLNVGGYVINATFDDPYETTSDVLDLHNKYGDNSIQINAFKDNSNVGFLAHYRVEGV